MIIKKVKEFELFKKVRLPERPLILGFLIIIVPIHILIYVYYVRTI